MNDYLGSFLAILIVGLTLFLVVLYLLDDRGSDPPEQRGFDLEDFRSDPDGEE